MVQLAVEPAGIKTLLSVIRDGDVLLFAYDMALMYAAYRPFRGGKGAVDASRTAMLFCGLEGRGWPMLATQGLRSPVSNPGFIEAARVLVGMQVLVEDVRVDVTSEEVGLDVVIGSLDDDEDADEEVVLLVEEISVVLGVMDEVVLLDDEVSAALDVEDDDVLLEAESDDSEDVALLEDDISLVVLVDAALETEEDATVLLDATELEEDTTAEVSTELDVVELSVELLELGVSELCVLVVDEVVAGAEDDSETHLPNPA